MKTKTDQQGDFVTFVYDRAHRLLAREYRDRLKQPTDPANDTDSFTHDARGQLLTAVSGRYSNTVAFSYDDAGRLASEALTAIGQTYTIGRGYDAASRLTQLVYPDGKIVARSYSPRNQLTQVNYDGSLAASFAYDNGGRETTRTFGNGLVTTRTYNADNTTATIDTPGVTSFTYSFDANMNKTAETIGGVMAPYGFDNTGYDDEDRLASWTRNDSNLTQAWNLSLVGDWSSFTENSVVQNRTHGPTHELTAIDTAPLTHDAKGNMTTNSNGQNYTWDFDNRLVSAVVPTGSPGGIVGTHTYTYDALGRRVSKTIDANGPNPSTTVFVCLTSPLEHSPYAGQELAEYSAGSPPASLQIAYVCATYIDDPILQINSPSSSPAFLYHHANDLFSRAVITDSTGAVLERYAYEPYGTRLVLDSSAQSLGAVSSFSITSGFTGRRHDPETSLTYYRARYVSPQLGRFAARDTIVPPHRYGFEGARPLIYVDPAGLQELFPYDWPWPPAKKPPVLGPPLPPGTKPKPPPTNPPFPPELNLPIPTYVPDDYVLTECTYTCDIKCSQWDAWKKPTCFGLIVKKDMSCFCMLGACKPSLFNHTFCITKIESSLPLNWQTNFTYYNVPPSEQCPKEMVVNKPIYVPKGIDLDWWDPLPDFDFPELKW